MSVTTNSSAPCTTVAWTQDAKLSILVKVKPNKSIDWATVTYKAQHICPQDPDLPNTVLATVLLNPNLLQQSGCIHYSQLPDTATLYKTPSFALVI